MGLASTACLMPAGWLTSCLGGNSLNHVMNRVDVVYIEGCLHARSQVITVSSDVSLIARVFGREALNLFSLHFERNITRLLHHVTSSTFYSFGSQFFELANGMAVSSPLFLMIVFFMEDFEGVTLDRAMYKPLCSVWYVNDAFVIWPQGPEELKDFFEQFTKKWKKAATFPFRIWIFIGDVMAVLVISHTINPPTPPSMLTVAFAFFHPTIKPCFVPSCTGQEGCVIKIAFTMTGVSESHFQVE